MNDLHDISGRSCSTEGIGGRSEVAGIGVWL